MTQTETVAPATHAGDRVHASKTQNGRLEFLDALRGIAALTVAVQHIGEKLYPQLDAFSHYWWRPGEFGVFVFFICSGFIIPASMERRGDLKEFWIGRVFRLFPLYLTVLLLALIAFATPWASPGAGYHPIGDSVINLTMLQVFTPRPLVIGASWTLGYEMVFYLLMTVLFMLGWNRRSAGIATGMVTGALVLGGFLVPFYLIQPQIRSWPAVVFGLVAMAVLIIVPRLRGQQRMVALAITIVILLAFLDRPQDLWFAVLLIASMFVGTVLYRYDIGELSRRTTAFVFGFAVFGICATEAFYHIGAPDPVTGVTPRWFTEAGTFVSAYALFGALFLLRRFSFPRVLVYFGTISYSVYLVHALVLLLPAPHLRHRYVFLIQLGIVLAASSLTYRFVERPGQALGRRLIARYRERRGRPGGTGATEPVRSDAPVPAAESTASEAASGSGNGWAPDGAPAAGPGPQRPTVPATTPT